MSRRLARTARSRCSSTASRRLRASRRLAAASSHVHLSGWHFSPDFALVRGASRSCSATCSPSSRSVSTCVYSRGEAPRYRSSGRRGRPSGGAWTSSPWNAGPMCPRRPRAPHALPPREDDRDRRPRRVCRRHRPQPGRRRPVRRATTRAGHARLARRRHTPRRAGGRRRRGAFPHALGRGDRRALEPGPTPQATGATPSRWSAPFPSVFTRRCRGGEFRILDAYLRALRSARSFIYLENQFLWSPEIAEVLRKK